MTDNLGATYVVAWAECVIEGRAAPAVDPISVGMTWRWRGRAMPVPGRVQSPGPRLAAEMGQSAYPLRPDLGIRRRHWGTLGEMAIPVGVADGAAHSDADAVHAGDEALGAASAEDAHPPEIEAQAGFAVSDGHRRYQAVPIRVDHGAQPLLLFSGALPPRGQDLTIVAYEPRAFRASDAAANSPSALLCFTPGTRLRTASGDVAIEELRQGDRVLTRDDGPQEVVWTGARRMSGARLFAMPQDRPVRLRQGALGIDRPDADLILSPDHRLLWRGHAARDLWGEDEVFVRAGDLLGDAAISVDHTLRRTSYVHLMLARHEVVWANGLEVETFHPGLAGLETLAVRDRERLFQDCPDVAYDPASYGPPARRVATKAEAALIPAAG